MQFFLASWVESYYCISCKERIYTPDIRTPIFYFLLHQNHQSFATEEMMHFSQKFGEREKNSPRKSMAIESLYITVNVCVPPVYWTGLADAAFSPKSSAIFEQRPIDLARRNTHIYLHHQTRIDRKALNCKRFSCYRQAQNICVYYAPMFLALFYMALPENHRLLQAKTLVIILFSTFK